ncbi:hypothetical protein ACSBR1_040361 [Camellia fascicularis]
MAKDGCWLRDGGRRKSLAIVAGDAPARTVGWRDPGFIHTSFLKELWPNSVYVRSYACMSCIEDRKCYSMGYQGVLLSVLQFYLQFNTRYVSHQLCRYTYRLGHRLFNDTYIWSPHYQFRASPYLSQNSPQRVVIFGDMGKV